jgi:hypothetical protein
MAQRCVEAAKGSEPAGMGDRRNDIKIGKAVLEIRAAVLKSGSRAEGRGRA